MKTSPSSRSAAYLEAQGFMVGKVDRYIAACRQTFDLFGFGDLIAVKAGAPHVLIQTTSGANLAARVDKILGKPPEEAETAESDRDRAARLRVRQNAVRWLQSGGEIVCHGWRKANGRKVGARKTWGLVERRIGLSDFQTPDAANGFLSETGE